MNREIDINWMVTEAHWLLVVARGYGEYGPGEEWLRRHEAWMKAYRDMLGVKPDEMKGQS